MFVQFIRDYAFWITLFAGIAIGGGAVYATTKLRKLTEDRECALAALEKTTTLEEAVHRKNSPE